MYKEELPGKIQDTFVLGDKQLLKNFRRVIKVCVPLLAHTLFICTLERFI